MHRVDISNRPLFTNECWRPSLSNQSRTEAPASQRLEFRVGALGAYIAPLIFAVGTFVYFVGFVVLDLTAIAAVGFIGLFVASWLAKSQQTFWNAAIDGIASRTSATLFLLMLLVGVLAQMFKATGVSAGFVWLAQEAHIGGGVFVMITFLITCAIALATGSSLGTMLAMFPILYTAGAAIGASPALLAGAILSGAIFGDNIAPISDTTVISATTQRYRRRAGLADVGGVVRSRLRYALPAAAIAAAGFLVAGLLTSGGGAAPAAVEADASPTGLWMLLAIAALILVAFIARDLFLAVGVGLVVGTIVALVTGLATPGQVLGAAEGAPTGFITDGITSMLPLISLLVAVFAMIGVVESSGMFDRIVEAIIGSPRFQSARGAEAAIGITGAVCTVVLAGLNGPGLMFAGPLSDKIGAAAGLHPYRRSNVMDCAAMGIGVIVPIASTFLLVASLGTQGYEGIPELSVFAILGAAFYPFALTAVTVFSIITGWGRRYEGENGVELTEPDPKWQAEMTATMPVVGLYRP